MKTAICAGHRYTFGTYILAASRARPFLSHDASEDISLMLSTVAAMRLANAVLQDAYRSFLTVKACLAGVGSTMSLFIGGLAFEDLHHQASIRLGVLIASILSASIGFAMLYFGPEARDPAPTPESQWKENQK